MSGHEQLLRANQPSRLQILVRGAFVGGAEQPEEVPRRQLRRARPLLEVDRLIGAIVAVTAGPVQLAIVAT